MSAEVSGSCSLCSCNRAERAHFAALSLQQKIPFLARGSETGSMTAWGACSLVQIVSTTQSSQTARFQDDPHSGAFCGDLRLFISWILVSASLQAPERRFLVSRLRVPKFRSRRLGLEPAVPGQSRPCCASAVVGNGEQLVCGGRTHCSKNENFSDCCRLSTAYPQEPV